MSNKLDSFSLSSGMEACLSLERELNKLLVRFEGIKDIGHNLLDTAISDIKTLQDDLGNGRNLGNILVNSSPLFLIFHVRIMTMFDFSP